MAASDLVSALRTAAADRRPIGRRGLWVSFLSAYGLEAALGGPPPGGSAYGDKAGGVRAAIRRRDQGGGDQAAAIRPAAIRRAAIRRAASTGSDWTSSTATWTWPMSSRSSGWPNARGWRSFPRMASHAADAIGRVVDAGVQGVIVPGVESADEAAALVRAIRLPPAGGRSTGAARTALGVTDVGEALLLPMVETAAGLHHAADIAAVDGVDGIFIGPYDLSMSLGCKPGEEPVMTAIASVVETVRSTGKIVGMFTGRPDLLALAPTLDLVAVDTDVTALRRGIAGLFS